MKKIYKRVIAYLLVAIMVSSTFMGWMPAMEVQAAETARTWVVLTGGTNNAGGHVYGNAAQKGPLFYTDSEKTMTSGGTISMALKPSNNWGVFYSYIDDSNWLYVGHDGSSGWYYQYKWNGQEAYPQISGLPEYEEGDEISLKITLNNETLSVTVNGTTVNSTNQKLKEYAAAISNSQENLGKFGVMTKGATTISFTDFMYNDADCMADKWVFNAERDGQIVREEKVAMMPVSGKITAKDGKGIADATVRVGLNATTTDAEGVFSFDAVQIGEYAFAVTKPGYQAYEGIVTVAEGEDNVFNAQLEEKAALDLSKYDTIASDDMTVYVGKDFPVVARYVMNESGAIFRANETALDKVVINGVAITPSETEAKDPVQEVFKDVVAGEWYVDAVQYVYDNGLMSGYEDEFTPQGTMTRAMIVTTLYRMEDSPKVTDTTAYDKFVDMKAGDWYKDAVAWALNEGIATGDPVNMKFNPNAGVTRQELAAFLYRYTQYQGGTVTETSDLAGLKNADKVDSWALTEVKWAVGKGLISGLAEVKDNQIVGYDLAPKSGATRAQMATILKRYCTAQTQTMAADADNAVDAEATSKTYVLGLVNEKNNIDLTMTVKVSVEGTNLTWEVTDLVKNEGCAKIATIDIPKLNLLTVDSVETEAEFAGAQVSTTTTSKADTYITFKEDGGFVPSDEDGYLYAFLSNGTLSAGLTSNSEAEGDKRVERINGADTMSLTSAVWYYESGDKNGQGNASVYDYQTSELPYAKVAIANGDLNKDGDIDWNDGAIAFREVMHVAQGAEAIKDLVNYRIVMNFESAAPNPFLVTADNVKKVYLATDGLPQALLLKGYGNEGHDSANSEYADIAEREGGLEDFQKLLEIAHEYNTEVGIHVNAQEAYPESKSFNETMISNGNGQIIGNGWGWLDQSSVINKLWDLSSDARLKRFTQLYDRINGTDFYSGDWEKGEYVKDSQGILTNGDGTTEVSREELLALVKEDAANRKDNMDFIYLDVWYQDAWETRRIAEEINSLGWRFSTEFSAEGEYDSTWQHWSTDTVYGGAGAKGYNSDIIRFLRNDQRDSQVLNWPKEYNTNGFGGTADNPLLGGFRLYGFEGWGGQQNFTSYIKGTFNENLPVRFLQHYEVIDWVNYGDDGSDEKSPVENTEKQITLANAEGDVVVVTRNEEQRKDIEIERTITLNGKVVLNTDVNESTYLLPWTDNQNGEEKLYHWNLDGGTKTWELQDGWANLANVVVYELSDQGRINGTTVDVVDGTVTLTAKKATAYVVVKGEALKTLKSDFGEGDYVVDPGFNGYADGAQLDAADWSGDITADGVAVKVSSNGDQRLEMANTAADVAVSTTISGLTAGEDYVAEVYVANESNAKAAITVNTGSKTVSNYTMRSIAGNYIACDSEHGSNMQRIQISFVAEGETATLTLSREAGDGYAHWDDIRIVNQKVDNFKADGSFVQDFESVVQGLYPFVLASYTGGDSRTHLAQKNAPYTQKGWNEKAVDDVIDGEWSLKHHENVTSLVYRTIPQNFRFEAGKVYNVEFDYQTASGGYQMVIGDGTSYQIGASYLPASTTTAHATMQVLGSGTGQTWIGLYMNGALCYNETSKGYSDFILDNLVIKEDPDAVAVTVGASELYLGETTSILGSALEKINWTTSADGVVEVDKENNVIKAIGAGTVTLTASWGEDGSATFDLVVTDTTVKTIARSEYPQISATANTEELTGEGAINGRASTIVDGDSDTFWHTQWMDTTFVVSESNPAILTIDLGKTMTIGGFRFQQRNQANRVITQYGYDIKAEDGTILATKRGIAVPAGQQAVKAWVNAVLAENVEARTIVVYVEEGIQGGNGCMAELEPIFVEKVAKKATVADASVAVESTVELKAVPVEGTVLKGLVWTSSDASVATVDANGVVTGVKAGTATITLSNALGTLATCTVTVTAE